MSKKNLTDGEPRTGAEGGPSTCTADANRPQTEQKCEHVPGDRVKPTDRGIHSTDGTQTRGKDLPLLDERLPGLLLDSLVPVEAAIVSAATGIGYREARQAIAVSEDEKLKFSRALEQLAAKHASFVVAHEPLFEFAAVFSAVNAAHVDHVFTIAKHSEGSGAEAEPAQPTVQACSKREALVAAIVVLAPLVIAAVVLIVKGRNK